jgi:putative ABC transport system ATP-binding protein
MGIGPLIELKDISKRYHVGDEDVFALREVSLSLDKGELAAIMGASGSGKTTLMNVIGCMDRPTGGVYRLEGREISSLKPDELAYVRNRQFGFVFQSFNLLARTTALENVELPLLYWNRLSARERHQRAQTALERLGLKDRMRHYPSQLSGGQQQRVAIARALINQPSVILADEPTGNLDSRSEREVMAIFKQLNDEGITVILVTHNQEIANYARRTIRIRDGMIQHD